MTDQHRELQKRIFAVLGELAKMLDTDSETLRVRMLLKTGLFNLVEMPPDWFPSGEWTDETELRPGWSYVIVVQSMARQLMDADDMRKFWNDMRAIIIREILPSLAEGDRVRIANLINGG